jgi:hypothetical protein
MKMLSAAADGESAVGFCFIQNRYWTDDWTTWYVPNDAL